MHTMFHAFLSSSRKHDTRNEMARACEQHLRSLLEGFLQSSVSRVTPSLAFLLLK
jgi:hypothetical protein